MQGMKVGILLHGGLGIEDLDELPDNPRDRLALQIDHVLLVIDAQDLQSTMNPAKNIDNIFKQKQNRMLNKELNLKSPPMCPGIFCPGQTLDLSLPDPMHPGLLWDLVTPRTSWPMPLKPQRFITPWKPRRTLQKQF